MSEKTVALLEKELEAANKELAAAKKAKEDAEKQVAEMKQELEDSASIVKELKAQLADSKNNKVPTVKVGDTTYKIVGGFRTKDRVYKPEDIASDSKVAKALVEKKSGLLQALPKR